MWRPLAGALRDRARIVAYDRRGWGDSKAPEGYRATTVGEQADDAGAVIEASRAAPAVVCGAGLGAVVALDLVLRGPELASAAMLIEPPLLAFVPEATATLSDDAAAVREAVAEGGPDAAFGLHASGRLTGLGPGAQRIPPHVSAAAARRPLTLFAELAAVPGWTLPVAELAGFAGEARIVVAGSTPPLLGRAARALATRMPTAELVELDGDGLPHVTAAAAVAELALELLRA